MIFDKVKIHAANIISGAQSMTEFVAERSAIIKDSTAQRDLSSIGIEFTIFLLVIALVLVPIGVKTYLNTNKSDVGIVSGSTLETIFDNIIPIMFVVILLAIIYMVKKE